MERAELMNQKLPANHTNKLQQNNLVKDLIFKEEAYAIIGACFSVYKEKGSGFLEPVYQECMEIELNHCKIIAQPKPSLFLTYRGLTLRQTYEPDFICYNKIIFE